MLWLIMKLDKVQREAFYKKACNCIRLSRNNNRKEFNMKSKNQKLTQLVSTAILAALVAVLSFVVLPIGAFNITFSLVPIMIGAILFGMGTGAFLGGVFGAVVSVQVVTGLAGAFSTAMLSVHPIITIVLCMLKGILAGFASGAVFTFFKKKQNLGVVISAVSCPIVNTGIFVGGLFLFYYPLMESFAQGSKFASAVAFIFIGVVGLNFIVEFAINVLLVPVVLRIIKIVMPNKE